MKSLNQFDKNDVESKNINNKEEINTETKDVVDVKMGTEK